MKISEYLKIEHIIPELKSTDKYEAIDELINLFSSGNLVDDLEGFRKCVHEREKIMTTGIGRGFAIPHGKSDSVKEIITAFGRHKVGIDFEATDNQLVNLIFLVVGRHDLVSQHLKIISAVSKMMLNDEFRNRILSASNAEEILKIFIEEDNNLN
jgi:fructose-specific phosphotransferase system IIA component